MAPIRRYLRITKYSVLEVRIYVEKPSDAPWLLSSRNPVLPRVIQAIRPKVLPKLREENENSKKKGTKRKKGIKDVVSRDDFEVVVFLTDSTTRHSLITKQKQFAQKPGIKSTSSKLTGWLNNTEDTAIDVDAERGVPGLLREDSDALPSLDDVPEATTNDQADTALFVSSSDDDAFQTQRHNTRRTRRGTEDNDDTKDENKKKAGLNTSYDGFSLYGKILCLIVKRKGARKAASTSAAAPTGGSEMMESWISTQVNQQADLEDADA